MIRLAAVVLVLALTPALAQEARPLAADEAVEQRLLAIAEELRCLVCQNETLAASRADLAEDLRRQIREQIKQGRSDDEIMQYMTNRYGDFVRYRPPFKTTTVLLWVGPFVLLAVAGGGLAWYVRRRRTRIPPAALTPEDEARVAALLAGDQRPRAAGTKRA